MVKLRLKRVGKKFHATYKIVASDVRAPRDGTFKEIKFKLWISNNILKSRCKTYWYC